MVEGGGRLDFSCTRDYTVLEARRLTFGRASLLPEARPSIELQRDMAGSGAETVFFEADALKG